MVTSMVFIMVLIHDMQGNLGGDDLGAGGIGPLCLDQVGQLFRDIHVGAFERPAVDAAETVQHRVADAHRAGIPGRHSP